MLMLPAAVQLSVAASNAVTGISDGHETVTFAGKVPVNTGLAVSSMVKTAVVEEAFPQASVAVKITSTLRALPQEATKLAAA